jgi:hypothetical protein
MTVPESSIKDSRIPSTVAEGSVRRSKPSQLSPIGTMDLLVTHIHRNLRRRSYQRSVGKAKKWLCFGCEVQYCDELVWRWGEEIVGGRPDRSSTATGKSRLKLHHPSCLQCSDLTLVSNIHRRVAQPMTVREPDLLWLARATDPWDPSFSVFATPV